MESADFKSLPLETPVSRRPQGAAIPLTAMQLWGWNYHVKEGKRKSTRTCAASMRIAGPLDTNVLKKCLATVVTRHEALRTRIIELGSSPRQHVDPPREFDLSVSDLSRISCKTAEGELEIQTQAFGNKSISLSTDSLFEAKLWKISDYDHVLILMLDHIVSDGFSFGLLKTEVLSLYHTESRGLATTLPDLPIHFADYAVWQARTSADWIKRHAQYWRMRLEGAANPLVPLRAVSAFAESVVGTPFAIQSGRMAGDRLREFARKEKTLLPLVVLAAYVIFLSRWCHERDLVVRVMSHGRGGQPEFMRVIGFFASYLHLRIQIHESDRPIDLLKQIQLEWLSALQHRDFDRVPSLIGAHETKLTFNWQSKIQYDPSALSGLKVGEYPHRIHGSNRPLYNIDRPIAFAPGFIDSGSEIEIQIHFSPDLLAVNTVRWIIQSLIEIADIIVSSPTSTIRSLSYLHESPDE